MNNRNHYNNYQNGYRSQNQNNAYRQGSHSQSGRSSGQSRRDWFVQERFKLHQELLGVTVDINSLAAREQVLLQAKERLEAQRGKLAIQIIGMGLLRSGIPNPNVANYHMAHQRLTQELDSLPMQHHELQKKYAALIVKIDAIDIEIALIDTTP